VKTLIGEGLFKFGDVDGKYPEARLQHPIGVTYKDGLCLCRGHVQSQDQAGRPKTQTLETVIGTGKRGMSGRESEGSHAE
jgi:hypothetical protein